MQVKKKFSLIAEFRVCLISRMLQILESRVPIPDVELLGLVTAKVNMQS